MTYKELTTKIDTSQEPIEVWVGEGMLIILRRNYTVEVLEKGCCGNSFVKIYKK